jgi:hypothetical protein
VVSGIYIEHLLLLNARTLLEVHRSIAIIYALPKFQTATAYLENPVPVANPPISLMYSHFRRLGFLSQSWDIQDLP